MASLWQPPRSGALEDVWSAFALLLDLFRRGALAPYALPRRVSSATTLLSTDRVLLVDTTSGAVTVTLPPAASVPAQSYEVKLIAGANNVTLDADGSENIYTTAGAGTLAWNTTGMTKRIHPAIITTPATWGWVSLD